MDRKTILKHLSDIRRVKFSMWEDYKNPKANWEREMRGSYDMEIRTLDYLMEAIKRNDFI